MKTFIFTALVLLLLCACSTQQPRSGLQLGGIPLLENPPSEKSIDELLRYMASLSHLEAQRRVTLLKTAFDDYRTNRTAPNALRLALMMNRQAANETDATLEKEISSLDPPLPATIQVLARDLAGARRRHAKLVRNDADAQLEITQLQSSLKRLRQDSEKELQALRVANHTAEAKIQALTAIEEEITRTVANDIRAP
ncbi:MAG: hypothetical protein ACI9BW_001955 [Gammaproteobacteria bacterium]|jgi:hypothetical protein